MKKLPIVLCLLMLLISLSGCDHGNNCVPPPFGPLVYIVYVDQAGNDLMKGVDKNSVEIVSITDQAGNKIQGGSGIGYLHGEHAYFGINIGESFTLGRSPKAERIYTIRYKIPVLLGEDRVETLKLVYLVDGWGKYTEAWYNQEKIENCYNPDRYNPEVGPLSPAQIEENLEAEHNAIYSGNTGAFFGGSSILLALSIDKP